MVNGLPKTLALQTSPEIIIRGRPRGARDNSLGLLISPGTDILPPRIIERPATTPGLKLLPVKIG